MIETFLNAVRGYSVIHEGKPIEAGIDYEVNHSYDAFNVSEDEEICLKVIEAAKRVGLKPKLVPGMGGSDANNFNSHGIKVITLGTGIRNAHSRMESIAIPDMVKTAELLVQFLTVKS